jgi:hypothetical protein
MELPLSKSSTSESEIRVGDLRYSLLGKKITVRGRDVTLGLHGGPSVLLTGQLESIRMSSGRVTLVMGIRFPRRQFRESRVIQMTEVP